MNRRNPTNRLTRTASIWGPLFIVAILFAILFVGCQERREERRKARAEAASQYFGGRLGGGLSGRREAANGDRPPAVVGLTADAALNDLFETYANAKYYSDDARVEIFCERRSDGCVFGRGRERFSVEIPCAFSFAKPNFVEARIGRALLRSDGEKMRAQIDDSARANQYIELPAPMVLTSIKELYPDAQFAAAADLGVPTNLFWAPPQAILLLAKTPRKTLVPEGAQTTLLPPEYLRDENDASPDESNDSNNASAVVCDRVQVADDDGVRIFWIDRQTKTLARLELPIERVSVPENVERVAKLRIEFPNRILSDVAPNELKNFRISPLDRSKHARLVDRFLPPELLAIGRKFPTAPLRSLVSGFSDATLDAPDSDKKTLLCFWGSTSENAPNLGERSEMFLKEFERTAQYNANDARIDFFAVNFDPPDVSDDVARLEFGAKGATTPLFRLDRTAFDAADFPAPELPSFMLIDERGIVQKYFSSPVLFARLQRQIARSFADSNADADVADDEFEAYYADVKRFADRLDSAVANDVYRDFSDVRDARPASTPPRQFPQSFGLREIWKFDGLYAPTNPLAVSATERSEAPAAASDVTTQPDVPPAPTPNESGIVPLAAQTLPDELLVVPCDGNALAILSSKGRLLRKTTPAAAVGEPISFVRTIKYGDQKRFYVASSRLRSRKVHRFDENFNDLGALDVGRLDGRRVGDARFFDVDSDGTPELALGLVGDPTAETPSTSGLYAVEMKTPKIRWKDESIVAPYRLGVRIRPTETPPRRLLATNRAGVVGTIVENDVATGARLGELRANGPDSPDAFASFAVSDATASGESNVVAILAQAEPSATFFVGLGADGSILWKNRLDSFDAEGSEMERVVSGDLDGDGIDEWIVATPDGIIRFFAADGKPIDVFQTGEEISGVCVARWGGESYLIVADLNKVSAWKIEKRR